MPGLVDDYAAPLGPIGVAIALGFWLWALAYLWVASAVVTAVLAERALERERAERALALPSAQTLKRMFSTSPSSTT